MNRTRSALAGFIALLGLVGFAPAAGASSGTPHLQRLAVAQTRLLFDFYDGYPQPISPPRCDQGQSENGYYGVFLLPIDSFGAGNRTVNCETNTSSVLLDLGGGVVTEDARGDTYTLANGTKLRFLRKNLEAICDDASRYFTGVPATVDHKSISGPTVVTRDFSLDVNLDAAAPGLPFYQDSVDLGHPGRLAACYTGTKALLSLTPGRHVVIAHLAGLTGAPTRFTYIITVKQV